MDVRKLLLATDITDAAACEGMVRGLLPLKAMGLERVLILRTPEACDPGPYLTAGALESETLEGGAMRLTNVAGQARDATVSLLVIGSNGGFGHARSKSALRAFFRALPAPAVFFPGGEADSPPPAENLFHHVTFASDLTGASEETLRALIGFGGLIHELEIINVIDKRITIKEMRELKERLALARALCLKEGVDAEAHIYAGKTPEEIVLAARDYKTSLIAVGFGTGGPRGPVAGMFLDCTAHQVLRQSRVPVLVIPAGHAGHRRA